MPIGIQDSFLTFFVTFLCQDKKVREKNNFPADRQAQHDKSFRSINKKALLIC